MNIQKRSFIAFLLITLFITFSSCDKDRYHTKASTLDILPPELRTNAKGIFYTSEVISRWDIDGINHHREDIIDIRLRGSLFLIESRNMRSGYRIELDIHCSDVGTYSETYLVGSFDSMTYGIRFDTKDSRYASFIDKVFKALERHDNVSLKISGQIFDNSGYVVSNIPLLITVNNNLDVKVRD